MVPVVVVLRPNSNMMRKKNPRRYTETEEYKNLVLVSCIDRQICSLGHCLASEPRDPSDRPYRHS